MLSISTFTITIPWSTISPLISSTSTSGDLLQTNYTQGWWPPSQLCCQLVSAVYWHQSTRQHWQPNTITRLLFQHYVYQISQVIAAIQWSYVNCSARLPTASTCYHCLFHSTNTSPTGRDCMFPVTNSSSSIKQWSPALQDNKCQVNKSQLTTTSSIRAAIDHLSISCLLTARLLSQLVSSC